MQFHDAPRTAVRVWIGAARLPLRAVEAVVHHDDTDAEWPPVLAFESFESQVKQVVGSVLRDEDLVAEGRLIEAKVARLREAAALETVAERREAMAAARFEAREEASARRRQRVSREAAERERALEREADERKHRIEQEAQREKQETARAEAEARKTAARRERAAASTRVAGERASVQKERAAAAAKRRAVTADQEIRATKAARKAGT